MSSPGNESIEAMVAEFCDDHDLDLGEQVHKLSEETGEVSGAYLGMNGQQRFKAERSKEGFAEELGQVVYTARTIAHLADIDLDHWVREVAEYNEKRTEVA